MIEPLAGLIPRLKIARVRNVERKPKSNDEHNYKEALKEALVGKRANNGSSQGTFRDGRGNLFDQLL